MLKFVNKNLSLATILDLETEIKGETSEGVKVSRGIQDYSIDSKFRYWLGRMLDDCERVSKRYRAAREALITKWGAESSPGSGLYTIKTEIKSGKGMIPNPALKSYYDENNLLLAEIDKIKLLVEVPLELIPPVMDSPANNFLRLCVVAEELEVIDESVDVIVETAPIPLPVKDEELMPILKKAKKETPAKKAKETKVVPITPSKEEAPMPATPPRVRRPR